MHGLPIEFWWAFGLGSVVLLLLSLAIVAILVSSQRRSLRDQKERLEQLSRSEEKYRSLFENSLVGLVRISLDRSSVIDANEAALKLFNCDSVARLTDELPRSMGEAYRELLFQLRRDGFAENRECRFLRTGKPDGWCIVAARVDAKQQVAECVILDVIEKKSVEAQLLRAQRLESIGVMAGGIAHDLNNVLTPIFGAVDYLLQQKWNAVGERFLEIIRASARRAADLVAHLLVFARGVEGKRKPLNPVTVGKEVLKFIGETFPKQIDLQFFGGQTVWNILADATQLNQVLLNLCVNARDAMPHGGRLSLRMENVVLDRNVVGVNAVAAPGPYVRISVEDTGAGIQQEILDKIFEPFFTTKEIGKGSGLGLSTTIGIVKGHQAVMAVESIASQGTTFSIYFPVAPQTVAEPVAQYAPKRSMGNGQWLLLVDDEEAVLEAFKIVLESNGYRVHVAEDGNQALSVFAAHEEEIRGVITDVMMPNRGGVETIRELRKRKPALPIIAISGMSFPNELRELGEYRPNAILQKPFDTELLLELVNEHFH
jgi:signal transduction histidine kinase/CheY-like chemotaxis protein